MRQCASVQKTWNKKKCHLVATGGIRDGLQVAKAIAMGATLTGIGLPLFRAIVSPEEGMTPEQCLDETLQFYRRSLEIAMFCSGAEKLSDLEKRLIEKRN